MREVTESRPLGDPSAGSELLHELMRRSHLSSPGDLPAIAVDEAHKAGATDVAIYLIDYDQAVLVPTPGSEGEELEELSVSGTVAGRAYASTVILRKTGEGGEERLWIPLLDGTERLGVLGMTFADKPSEALVASCERFAHALAILIVSKGAYGDVFELVRRRRPMTLASELLWSLVPPLVFATDRVAVAGMLEPCYDNGGDTLDYGVQRDTLHLGVFDAMGHGLTAAGVAAFALAAYRQSRRDGRGLEETFGAMDAAVEQQFPDNRFVTAVIAQLDMLTGTLSWINAGHPPPLLIRGGRRARILQAPTAPPLGVGIAHDPPVVASESLEPGDLLLLYTDGLTEARDADGNLLGIEGLTGFIEREASAGQTTPETLRRLRLAIAASERATLRDDATALLVEWRRGPDTDLLPQTVL